jgi:hypothetical protein
MTLQRIFVCQTVGPRATHPLFDFGREEEDVPGKKRGESLVFRWILGEQLSSLNLKTVIT